MNAVRKRSNLWPDMMTVDRQIKWRNKHFTLTQQRRPEGAKCCLCVCESAVWRTDTSPKRSNNVCSRCRCRQESCVRSADKAFIQFTSAWRGAFRGESCLCGANGFFVWMQAAGGTLALRRVNFQKPFRAAMKCHNHHWVAAVPFSHSDHQKITNKQTNKPRTWSTWLHLRWRWFQAREASEVQRQ